MNAVPSDVFGWAARGAPQVARVQLVQPRRRRAPAVPHALIERALEVLEQRGAVSTPLLQAAGFEAAQAIDVIERLAARRLIAAAGRAGRSRVYRKASGYVRPGTVADGSDAQRALGVLQHKRSFTVRDVEQALSLASNAASSAVHDLVASGLARRLNAPGPGRAQHYLFLRRPA